MLRKLLKILGIALLVPLFFGLFSLSTQEQVNEIIPRKKRSSEKGIYITAAVSKTKTYFKYIKRQAKRSGINTIVIDAKRDLEPPVLEMIKRRELKKDSNVLSNPWLTKLVKDLHKDGFIVTARLVVFKDDHLAIARPDLAIRVKGGALYRDFKWGRWVDPYSEEVRLYNEKIAEIAALSGVDEVQFDYIRFPAEGNYRDAHYEFDQDGISRVDIICQFLSDVKKRLERFNISLGVDIFGVTAWQKEYDIEGLGQDLKKMSEYIDVVSPMFYPSHFHSGYDGFENPGEHPYYFVNTGVKRAKMILGRTKVKIIPWIQGFDLRSPNFGPDYIRAQIKACPEGFLVWNAANNYSTTFSALR